MKATGPDSVFFPGEIVGDCVLQTVLRIRERREVWAAFDRKRQCRAVMKFIRRDHPRAAALPQLAEFLAHTACRRLVRLWAVPEVVGWFAAEMEYLSGGSLSRRLKRMHRLTLGQAVWVMRETLTALAELHRNGIVHRDLKPGNIWFSAAGELRVGDLEIAKTTSVPEVGPAVFGTPSAMSPEQTIDTTAVDARSDFFSLASLVCESLTGRPRFPRAGLVETARLIRAGRPEEMMRDLREFAPPDLSRLLGWMAAAHRMERPSDAATILNELERFRLPCEPLLPE